MPAATAPRASRLFARLNLVIAALAAAGVTVWLVHQTVRRSAEARQDVVDTQGVLSASESALSMVFETEAAAIDFEIAGDGQLRAALGRIGPAAETALDRLAALTADNPNQQGRIAELRRQVREAMAALTAIADAGRDGRAADPADRARAAGALHEARVLLQAIRLETHRRLDDRSRSEAAAIGRLQTLAVAVAIAALALLGCVLVLYSRSASRGEQRAEGLRRANEALESQIGVSIADLHDSHERLRAIIDSAVDGIIVIDGRGAIESFNRGAERLFGYPAGEVIGRNISMLMPPPFHEEHDGYLERYQKTGTARIIGVGREVTGRRRDGGTFPLHLSVAELSVGGERKFTGILHDLTNRVRIEEQLRTQAGLAQVGEMAAVIAHEVRNPLAGVRGAIEVIGSHLPEGSPDRPIIREIVTRIDALNELVQDLLLFARPPQPRFSTVNLASIVSRTAEILNSDPAQAGIAIQLEGAAQAVTADADLLTIVFQNLLVNAAHAMKGQGTIRVEFGNDNGYAQVSIADSGPGIPPDVRERIFTAFFTTKARGSGLGLPTAQRLVEAHHGHIVIECPPQGGTTVTVRLPA